jgi:hypothetical protein
MSFVDSMSAYVQCQLMKKKREPRDLAAEVAETIAASEATVVELHEDDKPDVSQWPEKMRAACLKAQERKKKRPFKRGQKRVQ